MAEFAYGAVEHALVEHEHRELARGIDRIHEVARYVGRITPDDLSIALLEVLDWVDSVLEPHAAWEDAMLYPEIDRRAGSTWATRLMQFEHVQIRRIASTLELDRDALGREPSLAELDELRGHLYALEALIRAHLEREERFLIPLLDEARPERTRQEGSPRESTPRERLPKGALSREAARGPA